MLCLYFGNSVAHSHNQFLSGVPRDFEVDVVVGLDAILEPTTAGATLLLLVGTTVWMVYTPLGKPGGDARFWFVVALQQFFLSANSGSMLAGGLAILPSEHLAGRCVIALMPCPR